MQARMTMFAATDDHTMVLPSRMPVYFLSHGGGPWPFMQGPFREMFRALEGMLRDIPRQLPARPRAVLVISAHWEAARFTLSTATRPGTIHDYAGFPASMYRIAYPAPGAPDVAMAVAALLETAGLPVAFDSERGYDHGTYGVLAPIYPDADIPVLQMSLRLPLDEAEHLAMGQALAPLRDNGILIIGSGQSFHNLTLRGAQAREASDLFDQWLRRVVEAPAVDRNQALIAWTKAPAARIAHPHADHLIPLHVAAGAASDDAGVCIFRDRIADMAISAYRFGGDAAVAI
jgi:aromatic ring-opening dioxygenase catalytic subunit (LigB family)